MGRSFMKNVRWTRYSGAVKSVSKNQRGEKPMSSANRAFLSPLSSGTIPPPRQQEALRRAFTDGLGPETL